MVWEAEGCLGVAAGGVLVGAVEIMKRCARHFKIAKENVVVVHKDEGRMVEVETAAENGGRGFSVLTVRLC